MRPDEPIAATPTPNALRLLPTFLYQLLKMPLRNPRLWIGLAWMDVIQNYRRTILGPFWITLNLFIFSGAMTLVYGALFGVPTKEYAIYLTTGMIGWYWISALLTEVGGVFITYNAFIKGSTVPKVFFIWAVVFKQVIVFAHQMIVYFCFVIFGLVTLTYSTLVIIPALLVLFAVSIPVTAIAAILFTRYRDLPRLINSAIIVVLMITPIFWKPEMISGWRTALIYLNPVYYFVEFIRAPLLGQPEDPIVVAVVLSITIVLWIVGSFVYRRYEKYAVFWL